MTDEQRQQLIRDLNAVANAPRYGGACSVCKEAAEEIERLTTLLTVLQRDRAMEGDMNEQPDAEQILDGIGEALESRGYVHMTNGKSIGELLDELEVLRMQSPRRVAE